MDKPQMNFADIYRFTKAAWYMIMWHSGKFSKNRKLISGYQGLGVKEGVDFKGTQGYFFCGKKVFYILIVVIYMTTCYCQNSQNCKLKEMNAPAYKFYLNKPDFNF